MDREYKKKPITFLIIFITVLVTLSLEVAGYFVYNEYFVKKDKKSDVKEEEKEEIKIEEITASEQIQIMKRVEDYLYFAKYYPITDPSVIDNQDILRFVITQLENQSSDLTKANVESTVKYYFGDTVNLNFMDVICFIDQKVLYRYDEETEKFILEADEHGHGGDGFYRAEFEFISGTKKGDEYKIEVKTLYYSYCSGPCGPLTAVYQTPQDSIDNTNRVLTLKDSDSDEISELEKKEALDKLKITKYTLKRKNNNYILTSITNE